MSQAQSAQQKTGPSRKWAKAKVVTVVVIVVLATLAAVFFWMAWDYRGAKNRSQHTLIIEMTNSLSTATMRVHFMLDDDSTVESRSAEARWAYLMLDRLHWDALAVGDMFTGGSSARKTFYELAYAFDELKMAVAQGQAQIAESGDIEDSLNSGLEDSVDDLNLIYQELWDAMDKSFSWSDYPPSTVQYVDLGYVKGLAAEIRASV